MGHYLVIHSLPTFVHSHSYFYSLYLATIPMILSIHPIFAITFLLRVSILQFTASHYPDPLSFYFLSSFSYSGDHSQDNVDTLNPRHHNLRVIHSSAQSQPFSFFQVLLPIFQLSDDPCIYDIPPSDYNNLFSFNTDFIHHLILSTSALSSQQKILSSPSWRRT